MESSHSLYNETPRPEFDFLTPTQMDELLFADFGVGPVCVNDSDAAFDEIPILRQIGALLELISDPKGVKLTAAGYLPVVLVKELYSLGFLKDELIECGISALRSESDSETIQTTRFVADLAGFTRKQHGRLLPTKKGRAFRDQPRALSTILSVFGDKYYLGYFDGYENEFIAQRGFKYSIYLLSKYGATERRMDFYASKYFQAFPEVLSPRVRHEASCYSLRTFERFLDFFGFTNPIQSASLRETVKKTALMDKYIEIAVSRAV
jgi:hypothetical protein